MTTESETAYTELYRPMETAGRRPAYVPLRMISWRPREPMVHGGPCKTGELVDCEERRSAGCDGAWIVPMR